MRIAPTLLATGLSALVSACSTQDWGRFAMDQICYQLTTRDSGGHCVDAQKDYETYKAEREALQAGKTVPPPLYPRNP